MKRKRLTVGYGYLRGKEDKSKHNCYDPYRWIKAWARYDYLFVKGYNIGFYGIK